MKKRKDENWQDIRKWFLYGIIPSLKKIIKEGHSHPQDMTWEEWKEILERIIIGFEKAKKVVDTKALSDKKLIDESFDLFKKHFFDLWD